MCFYMPREKEQPEEEDEVHECARRNCEEEGGKVWINDTGKAVFYCNRHFPGDMYIE